MTLFYCSDFTTLVKALRNHQFHHVHMFNSEGEIEPTTMAPTASPVSFLCFFDRKRI